MKPLPLMTDTAAVMRYCCDEQARCCDGTAVDRSPAGVYFSADPVLEWRSGVWITAGHDWPSRCNKSVSRDRFVLEVCKPNEVHWTLFL